jgi:short-subunit dehydrogenase
MKFPHEVVAITGASSGIGAELALQLAKLGCRVGLMARRKEALEEVARRVEDAGGQAATFETDVGDADNVKDAVAHITESLGPIDCMVANAGIGQPVEARNFDTEVTERLFRTNLCGMTNAFYAVLPKMLERERGHLVAIASLASYQGMPQDAGYSASKAAMRIHCESMRTELRGSGVDVTCICPGFIRTPLTDRNEFDMPFLLEVDTACSKMVKAIAKRRRIYNFPWQLWWIVRMGQMVPRWIYDPIMAGQSGKVDNTKRTQRRSHETETGR